MIISVLVNFSINSSSLPSRSACANWWNKSWKLKKAAKKYLRQAEWARALVAKPFLRNKMRFANASRSEEKDIHSLLNKSAHREFPNQNCIDRRIEREIEVLQSFIICYSCSSSQIHKFTLKPEFYLITKNHSKKLESKKADCSELP